MVKIRIGKNIGIRWRITTNGEDVSLVGRNLLLFVRHPFMQPKQIDMMVEDGNVVAAVFRGVEQHFIGAYTLTLYEDYDMETQNIVDQCDAFELVRCSCEESNKGDLATTGIEVLVSDFIAGVEGLSAYEVAVKNGFSGSEEEWLDSLSLDSKTAANECRELMQSLSAAEESRDANEELRKGSEVERIANEQTRVSNEAERVAAEQARVAAETSREETFATYASTLAAKEDTANKVTTLDADADDVHYPSAKAVKAALSELARKVGNISGVYEFDYSKGDHSSNKDRFNCNIEQGETFSLEVLLSTSIDGGVATYVKYEGDNNTTLLASFPVNTKNVFTAARKIVSIGVYFNASDSGAAIVHFTSNENLQGKASTQFVDGLKKEIDSDIEVLQKKDLFLETKIGAYRDDIVNNGNGSDWVYFTFNDLYPECTYKLTFTGNITDASGEGQTAFAQCTVLLKDGTSKTVFNIGKGGTFASGASYILNGITRLSANFRYQSNEELSASLESVSDAEILVEEVSKNVTKSIAEISDLLDVGDVLSSTSAAISVDTIYLGNTNNSVDCLADNIYYEIKPNSTIKLICAEKIRVRVSEYDSNKKYIKDSGAYAKITEYTTGDATCFVRISATYADRGYNSSNPISVGVFSPDDFGFIFTKSNVINALKEENAELGLTKQDKIIGSINQYNYKTAVKGQLTASGFSSNADVYVSDYIYCKGQSKVSANYAGRTGLYVYFYDANLNVVDKKLQHKNYTWDIPTNAVFLRINMSYYNTTGMVVFGEAEEAQTYVPYKDVSYIFDTLEQHGQKIAEMSEGSVESFNKDKESAILAIRNAAPNKYAVANKGLYPVFGVITDIHSDWTRMRRALDYCEKKNVEALLVLGDIGDNQAALEAFDWQGFVLNSSIPVLAIPGNHEFVYNAGQTSYVGYTDETLAAKLYNSELVSHNGEIHPSGKNYWYKDIQKSVRGVDYKLRIIGIYQHEFVDTWTDGHPDHTQNSGLAKDDVYYKQAQIDWLVNLLDNTDENTHVVLLVHWAVTNNLSRVESAWTPSDKVGVGITSGVTHGSNNDMIPMIVNAWINGTNVNTSSTMRTDGSTISVNHTFGASHHGKFVGYFSGHTHHDAITKVAEMDEQFNYAFNCTTNNDSQQSGDTPRSADGKCQDSFSLVGYDFLKNRVSLVKIGSDVTVDMKDRKYACNFNS